MWCDDILNIQMVQSRLVLYANSRMYARIPGDLFADNDNVEIELPMDSVKLKGGDAVRDYFEKRLQQALYNGNTLGTNQSTSQWINITSDGMRAKGRWYTYTVRIEGSAYGHEKPPYPYHMFVGRYDNEFVKLDQGWRLEKLFWLPLYDLGSYPCYPNEKGNLHKDVEGWPDPYPFFEINRICSDSLEDEVWCQDVLEIENLHGAFVDAWNRGDFLTMAEQFFTFKEPELYCQGLGGSLRGIAAVKKYFQWLARRPGGIQLATSRVIEVQPGGMLARGMWTSLTMDILDINPVKMSNRTGRWYIDFVKENGQWKYKNYQWHLFCEMTPFRGRIINAG